MPRPARRAEGTAPLEATLTQHVKWGAEGPRASWHRHERRASAVLAPGWPPAGTDQLGTACSAVTAAA